jgi:hypothetical protein
MTNAIMQLQFFSLNNLVNAVNKVFKSPVQRRFISRTAVTNESRVMELWMKN